MTTRTIRSEMTEADWDAYLLEATNRAARNAAHGFRRYLQWLPGAFMAALSLWTIAAMASGANYRIPLYALLAVLVFTSLLRLMGRVSARPARDGIFLGPVEIALGPAGMHLRRETYQSFVAWNSACAVSSSPAYVFVWLDVFTAQLIPTRDLPPELSAEQLEREIQAFIANPPAPEALASHAQPATDVIQTQGLAPLDPVTPLPGTWTELQQLLRIFHFSDARSSLIHGLDSTISFLGLSALALWILFERLESGPSAQFMIHALPGAAWFATAGLAVAWAFSRLSRPRVKFRRTLLLVAAFAVFMSLAFGVGGLGGYTGELVATFIVVGEAFIFFGRGLLILSGQPQRRAFFAGAGVLLACMTFNGYFYFSPSFWYVPDPELEDSLAEDPAPRLKRDQLAFDQALHVQHGLSALKRRQSPEPQVFFLGFAGYGEQRVFAGEIDMAASRVAARYNTEQRSLRLVNDRRDREKYPWASVSALNSALRGLPRVMDVDRDVLFLALSSHGSEEGYLSVNDGLPFTRDLYAEELAQMLRESGIRWKVLVISACHAGSFIDDLKDENTIVLTAAAAERTSFGCTDDRDLTYFGEAFFRDALPKAESLREAFELARADIARREIAEGISISDPQAHFGAAMERKLADIEASR